MRRRLPGFRFEAQPPPRDVLPRMDIAAFVGFAAAGPLHCLVAVEDPAQYAAIFGADTALAWDKERGEWVNAYLGGAVRAFLRNGGRRCWVVRVADGAAAAAARYALPGLLAVDVPGIRPAELIAARNDPAGIHEDILAAALTAPLLVRPALAWARSEGSWADALRAGASLTVEPLAIQNVTAGASGDVLTVQTAAQAAPGDLLRLRYPDQELVAFLAVLSVSELRLPPSVTGERRSVALYTGRAVWLSAVQPAGLPGSTAVWSDGVDESRAAVLAADSPGETLSLTVAATLGGAPAPGATVRIDTASGTVWLLAQDVRLDGGEDGSPPGAAVIVSGPAALVMPAPPAQPPSGTPVCERLRLELHARAGDADPQRIGQLDFSPLGPRYWGALPADNELYAPEAPAAREAYADLWQSAAEQHFPLAGRDPAASAPDRKEPATSDPDRAALFSFPLGMGTFPAQFVRPGLSDQPALARDGLSEFRRDLFLDLDLADLTTGELISKADDIRYIAPRTRALRGIHALLARDEVTLVAVPDAVHRGWDLVAGDDAAAPSPSDPPARPGWWHPWGCAVQNIPAPRLLLEPGTEPATLAVTWPAGAPPTDAGTPIYFLEEASRPDFNDAHRIYRGTAPRWPLPARPAGDYYYRVRVVAGENFSDWSKGLAQRVGECVNCPGQNEPLGAPEWGNFLDCEIRIIPPPDLRREAVDRLGTLSLTWSDQSQPPAAQEQRTYLLEEATVPDFAGASTVYRGSGERWTLYGRAPGDYYYRVRLVVGPNSSDWSPGLAVPIGSRHSWVLRPPDAEPPPNIALLSIQRALLRMCAARGDLFAVLSLPEHYREGETIAHAALLPPSAEPVFRTDGRMLDLPLGFGERPALSYGGLYHPWLIERGEDQELGRTPPDGAICGAIARRALARGAWIAPANERLTGIVALTPPLDPARWLDLQEAQVNVIRQEPYGFVTLSTDTLSQDPDLLQINVRRLLHLLRRLALGLGAGFVFEPHDDAFRRLVRREIESVLAGLFTRGAFAGATPDTSYQVVMRSTPQDVDAGRFVVDIKVAPALPMSFLTVRLVQTGGRSAVTEER